jgi:predicted nucleic acid-binding protein
MDMALLDTNVLVHAADRLSSLHAPAARLVDQGLRQRGRFCIAPQNLIEFSAVVTRPRLVRTTLPHDELSRMTGVLYRSRRLRKIYPKRGTAMRAIHEGARLGVIGPVWYDLYLALTMRDAGVEIIVTEDVGHFRRFAFVTPLRIDEAAQAQDHPP